MKLRQLPEDFKVHEIVSISKLNKNKGDYKVFLLRKNGLETFALFDHLSRKNNILRKEFGIAGIKDKYAITEQYFSIPSKYDLKTLKGDGFEITFVGFSDNKISLGDHESNKFEVVVRDITFNELEGISIRAESMSKIGVPNYYDSQRFGSVFDGQFIAKHLIKKDYEAAVKIYLTKYPQFELDTIQNEKDLILKNWDAIVKRNPNILNSIKIQTPELEAILKTYINSGSWIKAFKSINSKLRALMISAYQSYLWNECVRLLLWKLVTTKKLYTINYKIGTLLYYKQLSAEELEKLPSTFMSISDKAVFSDLEHEIIDKVLLKGDICLNDFKIKVQTENFFKSHARNLLLIPKDFTISNPEIDELNNRYSNHDRDKIFKMKLRFTLPKGSYATIITKRIFNH